jgi:hypothetical protein
MNVPELHAPRSSTSDLRLQIARQRRRVDARLLAVRREVQRLRSWRTYVEHFPGKALIAAFGIAMAATATFRGKRSGRQVGMFLARRAMGRTVGGLWTELWSLFSGAKTPTSDEGADHARP